MAVSISKPPTGKVKSLTLQRSGGDYTATWTLPSSATQDSNAGRWSKVRVVMAINGKKPHRMLDFNYALSTKKSTHDVSDAKGITRKSWWPYSKYKAASVKVTAAGVNSYGRKTHVGDAVAKSIVFKAPAPPTMAAAKFNASTESTKPTVSVDITAPDASTGARERAYVLLTTVKETYIGGVYKKTSTDQHLWESTPKGGTLTKSVEADDAMSLGAGDYVRYTFTAMSRGYAGDSAKVSRSFTIAFAERPTLGVPEVDLANGVVRVPVKAHASDASKAVHPTAQLKLMYACAEAAQGATFNDVSGAVASDAATALSTGLGSISPAQGERVYFKVRAVSPTSANYDSYSEPVEAVQLRNAEVTGTTSNVAVTSVTADKDGKSLIVSVGWVDDTYNATTLSWSTDADAWESTESPSEYGMEDSTWASAATAEWTGGTARLKVKGLEEGATVYFRARRYLTTDSTHGGWSELASGTVGSTPDGVTAAVPATIERGQSLRVVWEVTGSEQSAWSVTVNGVEVASGTGDATSCEVLPDSLPDSDALSVVVKSFGTGGSSSASQEAMVVVVSVPSVSSAVWGGTGPYLDETRRTVEITASSGASLFLRLVSLGGVYGTAAGPLEQIDGDVIWSGGVVAGEDGKASATLPDYLEIVEGTLYRMEVTPMLDGVMGDVALAVTSDEAHTSVLEGAYATQAVSPTACNILADVETLSAVLTPEVPEGASVGDTINVYRLTPIGVYQIADGIQPGSTVTDRWAPFGYGDTAYRVETVTAYGDRDWADFGYSLDCEDLVIDWPGGTVSMPYDVAFGDKWKKDCETVTYLDGTTLGHWGAGTVHGASLSTNLVKAEPWQVPMLASLARYAGSAFVRTPMGHAYEADVQVGGLDAKSDSGVIAVSIDATEVENGTYVCKDDDVIKPAGVV